MAQVASPFLLLTHLGISAWSCCVYRRPPLRPFGTLHLPTLPWFFLWLSHQLDGSQNCQPYLVKNFSLFFKIRWFWGSFLTKVVYYFHLNQDIATLSLCPVPKHPKNIFLHCLDIVCTVRVISQPYIPFKTQNKHVSCLMGSHKGCLESLYTICRWNKQIIMKACKVSLFLQNESIIWSDENISEFIAGNAQCQ